MSKPMVVTLPVIMILLDYWPLKRLESKKDNWVLRQLKEKVLLFILSAVIVIVTLYTPDTQNSPVNPDLKYFPLLSRLANSPVAFVTYLEKTLWPHDMTVFYPFSEQIPLWQVLGATFLIIAISVAVIVMAKRLPYLFVGWSWYSITIAPVIGIIQISISAPYAMADRYHYLPSIGIAILLAWGIPSLIKSEDARKKILFPVAIAFLLLLALSSWMQCHYWENSVTLFNHALQTTKNNYLAHDCRGSAYSKLGRYQQAIEDYNQAILMKPDYAHAYYNRGTVYGKLGRYKQAIEDYNQAITLKPDYDDAYYNRGTYYGLLGRYQQAIEDYNQAILMKPDYADAYYNRGTYYGLLGHYQSAIDDFNKAISLKQNFAGAYNNRGTVYLNQHDKKLGCLDAQKACAMGVCKALEMAESKGLCR
jgi:tetratricopeptide (TPR) repeat protein